MQGTALRVQPTADRRIRRIFPPMRVLVTLPDPDPLANLLKERRPELEVRSRKLSEVTPDDFEWAETMIGFRKPKLAGWGGIKWIHSIGAGVDGILYGQDV